MAGILGEITLSILTTLVEVDMDTIIFMAIIIMVMATTTTVIIITTAITIALVTVIIKESIMDHVTMVLLRKPLEQQVVEVAV